MQFYIVVSHTVNVQYCGVRTLILSFPVALALYSSPISALLRTVLLNSVAKTIAIIYYIHEFVLC